MIRGLAALAFAALASGVLAQAPTKVRVERIATLELGGGVTCAAAFAPDGRSVVTASERGDLMRIDLPARTVRWKVTPSDHFIETLAFAPDGRTLACMGRHLTLHDVADGKEIEKWPHAGPRGFAWRADGSRYAFAQRGGVLVVDAKSREQARVGFEYPVNGLAYAADGTLFVGDNIGRTWRLADGASAPTLLRDRRKKENGTVSSLAVACGGADLFDLASDGTLFRGDQAVALEGKPYWLAVATDGQSFAVGGGSKTARWWRQGGTESVAIDASANVSALAFAPDARTLLIATADGKQALHRDGEVPVELPDHLAPVRSTAMSPDGSVVAIQRDPAFGSPPAWTVLPALGGAPRRLPGALGVCEGRSGSELLVSWPTRTALIDGRTGRELVTVMEVHFPLESAAVGPGDTLLVNGSLLVDTTTHVRTRIPRALSLSNVWDTARTRDGLWGVGVVGGFEGEAGALWVTDARAHTLLVSDDGPVFSLAFSPDGKHVYYTHDKRNFFGVGPREQVLSVRDTTTFEITREIPARIGIWRFLDDAHALTTVNGQLQVWDVATLQAVQTVATDAPVGGFRLSDDRRTIAWSNGREMLVYRLLRGD